MRRREFVAGLAGAAAAWPLVVYAQQRSKIPIVGYLGAATASVQREWIVALTRRLHELGWDEGHNIVIEYRWAEGRSERFAEIAAEFVSRKVEVIVTSGPAPVLALMNATSNIPIVFAAAADPVGSKLVASLARPGGNVTGLSSQATDLGAKRLEILREAVPNLRQVAILANGSNPAAVLEMVEVQTAARILGLEDIALKFRQAEEIASVIGSVKGRVDALYVVADPLVNTNRAAINSLALSAKLPTMHSYRDYVDADGLMSYGPTFTDLFRRAGDYVDKILRGTKPADIPVEQPTKFDLIINLTTAKALGVTVPPSLLGRADEVIE
jgi:putative ABC transport system substrate-binding protein